jgi:hypothetical protein
LKEVVGDSVACQHGVDAIGCGPEAVVVDGLNRKEAEHSTGLERTANILNKVVVPGNGNIASAGCNDAGLCGIPKPMTADSLPSSLQAHTDNLAAPAEVASSGRVDYESWLDPEKYCR